MPKGGPCGYEGEWFLQDDEVDKDGRIVGLSCPRCGGKIELIPMEREPK
jgi:hypothetical protein